VLSKISSLNKHSFEGSILLSTQRILKKKYHSFHRNIKQHNHFQKWK